MDRDRTALIETNGLYNGSVFAGYRDVAFNEIYLLTNNTYKLAHVLGIRDPGEQADGPLHGVGELHTGMARHGGDVAVQRSGVVHPANGVRQRSRHRADSQFDRLADGREQPVGHRAGWRVAMARPRRHVGRELPGAVGHPAVDELHVPDRSLVRAGRDPGRRSQRNPQFGPPIVTLSNGRVVANPLATTIRFAGSDRTDQQFALPSIHI